MDKFEYDFGYIVLSKNQLKEKLNEWGLEGWDVMTFKQVNKTNELDRNGAVSFRYEVFMKRKIKEGNNEQQ
jgi:hypothetical protein